MRIVTPLGGLFGAPVHSVESSASAQEAVASEYCTDFNTPSSGKLISLPPSSVIVTVEVYGKSSSPFCANILQLLPWPGMSDMGPAVLEMVTSSLLLAKLASTDTQVNALITKLMTVAVIWWSNEDQV